MEKVYLSWIKQMYMSSCGLSSEDVDINNLKDSAEVKEVYKKHFLNPMQQLFPDKTLTYDLCKQVINIMNGSKVKNWLYVFDEIVLYFMLDSGDLERDLRTAASTFMQEYVAVVAGTNRGKDFFIYMNPNTTEIIGYVPRDCASFGVASEYCPGINNAQRLAKKSPWLLTDNEVKALKDLASFKGDDKLDVNDLCVEEMPLMVDHKFTRVKDNCLNPNLPPYEVRSLISSLSESTINEAGGDLYLAAYKYVSAHKNSFSVNAIKYLKSVVPDDCDNATLVQSLDKSAVVDYINNLYGKSYGSLDSIVSGDGNFDEKIKNMSIEDVLRARDEDTEVVSTLDDGIIMFCKERNMSFDCTINQLLDAMVTEVIPEPVNFVDTLLRYITENKIPKETTIQELLTGTKPATEVDIESVIKAIDNCNSISMAAKVGIVQALKGNDYFDRPSKEKVVTDYLASLDNVPGNIVEALYNNVKTGEPVEIVLPEAKPTVDKAYEVAELLLRAIRVELNKCDDDSVRSGAVPLLYSFLRVVMYNNNKPGVEDDVVRFLQQKMEETTPMFKPYIEQAIAIIKPM